MPNKVPTALVTGGAKRIGAEICRRLHEAGFNLAIHFNHSRQAALSLAQEFNKKRPHSAEIIYASLANKDTAASVADQVLSLFGRCDLLVNNASSFYATPLAEIDEAQWDDLFASNAKAPLFLAQALAESLKENRGSIINIADIHALRPMANHTLYCMAKAANIMLTKSLALELAPDIRVNGIAPGAMLWPERHNESNADLDSLAKIPLQQLGGISPIADAVLFFAAPNSYITGQILAIDGGKTLIQ